MSKIAVGLLQNGFVVRLMKYSGYERYKKVAIIVIAVGALLACTAAGTLAAFSATYTWQSDDGTAGDFGFSDTTYSFDLFGDAPMYPGMSGGAVLNGPDFGDNTVEWAFAESNAGKIPIVFYIEDTDGSIAGTYYSAYDFSALQDLFVRADDGGYIPLDAVSSDVMQLAKELHVGCRLCWLWPSEFYTDASGTPAEQTEAINAYAEYCKSLCRTVYGYGNNAVHILSEAAKNNVSFVAHDIADIDNSYLAVRLTDELSVDDNIISMKGEALALTDGSTFFVPSSPIDIKKDSAICIFLTQSACIEIERLLKSFDMCYVRDDVVYDYKSSNGQIILSAGTGNYMLIKIFPDKISGTKAAISITVTATVIV